MTGAEPGVFAAAWPIEDVDLTQSQLIAEAERDLPDLLHEAGVVITGTPRWRVTEAWRLGKTGLRVAAPSALVLALEVPAETWVDDHKPRRGRPRAAA